jgi:hypothetical protein
MPSSRNSSGGGRSGASLGGRVTRTRRSQKQQRRREKAFQERYERLCGPVETRMASDSEETSNDEEVK